MNYLKKALEKATPLDLKRRLNLRGTDTNLDTANFGGSLSSADNTAQKAFDTLDDHTHTTTFTGLTDTPGSITAGNLYQGNSGGTALEALAPSTSGNVLTSNGSKWTSAVPDTDPAGKLIAIIEDQQTSGTDGGGFTSGAAQTRTLNKLVYNRDTTVSLSSNQFTLPAGDWEIHWTAPGHRVDAHQSFLYNITGAAEVKRGTVMEAINASPGTGNRSEGSARVSIGTSTAYEIRHECETTKTTDGFGHAGGFGTEVFTKVIIRENTASASGGGGGSSGLWEQIARETFSAQSSVNIGGSQTPSSYDAYKLIIHFQPSADAVVNIWASNDGGSTKITNYVNHGDQTDSDATENIFASESSTTLSGTGAVDSSETNQPVDIEITLFNPGSSLYKNGYLVQSYHPTTAGKIVRSQMRYTLIEDTSAIDSFIMEPASGTITGHWVLTGMKVSP